MVASHVPSVFRVHVTLGELKAKIQMTPFSGVLLKDFQFKKIFYWNVFTASWKWESTSPRRATKKPLAALMDFVLLQIAVCISVSVRICTNCLNFSIIYIVNNTWDAVVRLSLNIFMLPRKTYKKAQALLLHFHWGYPTGFNDLYNLSIP